MRFRAEQHLRRQTDIQNVRHSGRRHDCGAFVIWYVRQPADKLPPARIAVVASRAAVGNAVKRARAKRRLRELFRNNQTLIPANNDLLLIARNAINKLEYSDLDQKFTDALKKIFKEKAVG